MKYRLFILLSLLIFLIHTTRSFAALDEFTVEQQGLFRYEYGQFEVNLNDSLLVTGCAHQYLIDLNGHIFNQDQDLSYTIYTAPGEKVDLQLIWNHPWFNAVFDKGINLSFSGLQLPLSKNRIDGFYFKSAQDYISVFSGKEAYIPMNFETPIHDASNNLIHLYDPPSAGDIVEYSEMILLDGELLERNQDYSLNYLNGKLQLFVPLEVGMLLQAKFLFIITNEDLITVRGEQLQGTILSHSWNENTIRAYYLKRGEHLNQVKGGSATIVEGPFTLNGEYAQSTDDTNKSGDAYNLKATYFDDVIQAEYQMQQIEPTFTEIGVNSFVRGNSNRFDLVYKAEKDIEFQLNLASYKMGEEEAARISSNATATTSYQFAQHQTAQFIFQQKVRTFLEESKDETDFALGYAYTTRPFHISFGQSIQTPENRFFRMKINTNPFSVEGTYQVESLWEGKQHQLQVDSSFRPIQSLNFNSFIDYTKQFDTPKGNLRYILNTTWQPVSSLSTTLGYVYFNNAKYDIDNTNYNLLANYQKDDLNSNLTATYTTLESPTNLTHDLDLSWNAATTLFTNYLLGYQIIHRNFSEYKKDEQIYNQNRVDHAQSLNLTYSWKDYYSLRGTLGFSRNGNAANHVWSYNSTFDLGLEWAYKHSIDGDHELSLGVNLLTKDAEKTIELTNKIIYPWKWLNVSHRLSLSAPTTLNKLSRGVLNTNLIFPKVFGFIPKIECQYEHIQPRTTITEGKGSFSGILQYDWTEHCSSYVKGVFERSIKEKAQAKSIFTGLEIKF